MYILLLTLLLLFSGVLHTQEIVTISNSNKIQNLAYQAQFIEDPFGNLQVQNLFDKSTATRFQPVRNQVVNFGITASVFWVKAAVRNEIGKDLVVKVGNNALSDIQLFEFVDDKLVSFYHSGNWLPFGNRQIKDVDFLFPLRVSMNRTATLVLRVHHTRGTQFPFQAASITAFYNQAGLQNVLQGIYFGFMLVMIFYNLFVYFSLRDPSYLYYVIYVFLMSIFNAAVTGYAYQFLWPSWPILNQYVDIQAVMVCMAGIVFTVSFLHTRKNTPVLHKVLCTLFAVYSAIAVTIACGYFVIGSIALEYISLALVIIFFITAYAVLRKGYRPAVFFILAWGFLLLSVVAYVLKDLNVLPINAFTENALQIGSAIEALLLSMALANRINVYKKEKQAAQLEALHSLEENKKLITEQNKLLEKKVEERTYELKKANTELSAALTRLQNTQAQLIQREKMASLGELTTGIAHEIQNPLNFVTNFSAVNKELVSELKQEVQTGRMEEVLSLALTIAENEEKISHHGRRAASIVKSMLQHSNGASGERQPIDINQLVEEHLRLAYRGYRAKESLFTVNVDTALDNSIGQVTAVPQDIGRVLINLFNNAFYAVQQKKKLLNGTFEPSVTVSTERRGEQVVITVADNGTGISQKIVDKVFQPFFTTKPPGEGTGLGLSHHRY